MALELELELGLALAVAKIGDESSDVGCDGGLLNHVGAESCDVGWANGAAWNDGDRGCGGGSQGEDGQGCQGANQIPRSRPFAK